MLALHTAFPGSNRWERGASWSQLGLDSFDLLSLRLAVEEAIGIQVADADWVAIACPNDLHTLAARAAAPAAPPAEAGVALVDSIEIAMPQMALSGLSESWLMKALGDWHWRLIGRALGTRPADIADGFGNRLYPTFTRVAFTASAPLGAFEEGERLDVRASLSRYGTGLFFSSVRLDGASGRSIEAELMSSFAQRGASGGNEGLLRGQPLLPEACAAPALREMPAFGRVYAERRRSRDAARPVLASVWYDILPQHDINGVGLLYYAAYPMIAEICRMRLADDPAGWATRTSTIARDICYFANADPGARLEWRLHRDEGGEGLATEASIVRGDGAVMALVASRKAPL